MANYCWVYGVIHFTSPAGWLPVHRNQLRAQRLVTSMGKTLPFYTHTHPFNDPLSGTTRVSRYQKDNTNLDFTAARDSEWQWYQLGHMQICTLLQTDNHASNPPLSFYRQDALPAAQSTVSKHWRQLIIYNYNSNKNYYDYYTRLMASFPG